MNRCRAARSLAWFLLSILAAGLATFWGCGSGTLGLTGGSIPIGTSALRGTVVRADNPKVAISDATVSIRQSRQNLGRVTDSHGKFDFGNIPGEPVTCTIQRNGDESLRNDWAWDLPVPAGTHAQLIAALWPASFDPSAVRKVELSPSSEVLRVGQTVRVAATVRDRSGAVLNVAPSLLLAGDAASVSADGSLTGLSPGRAKLTAWLYGKTAEVQIAVSP